MLSVAWFVVVDRTEAPAAYTARCIHGLESRPVFAAQGTVGISGVTHNTKRTAGPHQTRGAITYIALSACAKGAV